MPAHARFHGMIFPILKNHGEPMNNNTFLSWLERGARLVSDGATGTNLQKRGLPKGQPSDLWVLDNPEGVLQLHRDFIAAGSNVILTNTFGARSLQQKKSGLDGKTRELNLAAVELARRAAEGVDAFVAGSMGPLGELLQPFGTLSEDDALAAYREQAGCLLEGGVDLLVIETQFDLTEARVAVQAVRQLDENIPLICSFSYDRGTRTMMGVRPKQMAAEIGPLGVNALGINCGRSLDENLQALRELREATDLPIWFKPNAGLPGTDAAGNTTYSVTPEEMGARVAEWIEAGASVVGGCCGTSPEHVQQIAINLKRLQAA